MSPIKIFSAAALICCLSNPASAQPGGAPATAPPAGPVPRTADGKPDMNGYWNPQIPMVLNNVDDNPAGPPPYTPQARQMVEEIRMNRMAEEPEPCPLWPDGKTFQ